MLSSSTKSTRIVTGVLLSLISLYSLFYIARQRGVHTKLSNIYDQIASRPDFVNLALTSHVTNPYSQSAISSLCNSRPPRDDISIRCAPGTGGVGNIRSYVLHCVRFAMESGAAYLVIPQFQRRSTTDLFELHGSLADFEHFFDREHFRNMIQDACPHIKVVDSEDQTWGKLETGIPEFGSAINESTVDQPSPWRIEFDAWFLETTAKLSKPVLLTSGDPGRTRAVMDDGKDFYYNFGRILELRPDVRRLAATAIREMTRRFSVDIDPKQNIYRDAFAGAHLRTSDDAIKAGWNPDFEEQTEHYLSQASVANLKLIYAASGNDKDLERFADKAAQRGVDVVNKYDLLTGNDLRELINMSWDQRGLVDLEILMKSSVFGGYARSSFSHNVAFRRHFLSHVIDPFLHPQDRFIDELSRLYGRFDHYWEDEAWRTMWP